MQEATRRTFLRIKPQFLLLASCYHEVRYRRSPADVGDGEHGTIRLEPRAAGVCLTYYT